MSTPIRVGIAFTGSFCTFSRVLSVITDMSESGKYEITPIFSENASTLDTRFGTAKELYQKLADITPIKPINSIMDAEPIGPKGLFDVLVVAPCTGNTIAKLSHSITDTTVTMAVKSHLRCDKPVIIAVSTNDGLAGSAANIGKLLSRKNYFFVPFGQDAPQTKPRSLVAQMELIPDTIKYAINGKQIQPILV